VYETAKQWYCLLLSKEYLQGNITSFSMLPTQFVPDLGFVAEYYTVRNTIFGGLRISPLFTTWVSTSAGHIAWRGQIGYYSFYFSPAPPPYTNAVSSALIYKRTVCILPLCTYLCGYCCTCGRTDLRTPASQSGWRGCTWRRRDRQSRLASPCRTVTLFKSTQHGLKVRAILCLWSLKYILTTKVV
jgi:hypothetical protein